MKREKIVGIYKITSPSKKIYIGQSQNILKRFAQYKRYSCEHQDYLYHSLKKYGADKHIFEIIHVCSCEELDDLEIYYIDLYQSFNSKHGLNLKSGGLTRGELSDYSRRKIGKAHKGKTISEECREKLRKANLGKKTHSEEYKQKLRERMMGNKYTLGQKQSKETIEKRRVHLKGRVFTEEHKRKISESNKGRKSTKEQKEKELKIQENGN